MIQFSVSKFSTKPGRFSTENRQFTSPPSSSKLAEASRVTFSKVKTSSTTVICAVGVLPMKTSTLAILFVLLLSSVTKSSGSTTIFNVCVPIGSLAGTVQSTSTLASPNGGITGSVSVMVVPLGVVTSIVVLGDAMKPRFCVGIENDNKSPGNAL